MEECGEVELTKKCRACLCDESAETLMHCLFNEFDQGCTLGDLLSETMNSEDFKLEKNDGLPMNLCDNCTGVLVNFFNMKVRFEESQRYLKELLENTNKIVNVENNLDNIEECKDIVENDSEQSKPGSKEPTVGSIDSDFEAEHTKIKEGNIMEVPLLGGNDQSHSKLKLPSKHIAKTTISNLLYQAACRDSLTDCDDSSFELQEFQQYTCPYCTKCFFDVIFFQKHMTQVHGEEILLPEKYSTTIKMEVRKSEETSGRYTCFKCNNTFSNDEDLKTHLNTHKKFICEKCGLGFSKKNYLIDHEQVHEPSKIFECPFCGKAFQRRTVLVKHKRIHTNPRQVICDACGKAFNDRGALKTHIKLIHLGDRNFKCTICNQNFPLKSTLQKHMLRHSEDRKRIYSCDICSASYKDKSSLNRHYVLKHSDKKHKFTCKECGKKFVEKSSLNRHMINCSGKSLVGGDCKTVESEVKESLVT